MSGTTTKAVSKGIKISVLNTPQAKDDIFRIGEDGSTLLDVLANDLGGEAKTLWAVGTTSTSLAEMTAHNPTGTTDKGNKVSITEDGQIEFIPGFDLDSLGAGVLYTDTFQYAIRLANGTVSVATVRIDVVGTNDAPVVSGTVTGEAIEDDAAVTLNALANASDVDAGDTLSVVDVPANLPDGVSYDATTHSFRLDPSHDAYQHLAKDQTVTVTVNYGVSDGRATTAAAVEWTVTGTNDAPKVSGTVTGEATEDDATPVPLDALANATDVDDGDTLSMEDVPASLPAGVSYDATSHSFTLDPTDDAFQSLGAGITATVSVAYSVSDGTDKTAAAVEWTVTGVNDLATIAGGTTGAVEEDGTLAASGTLTVSDPDSGEAGFKPIAEDDLTTDYGSFTFDPDTGEWSFTLDNDAAQPLDDDDAPIERTLTVTSLDGTATQTITVTVTGTNDAPVAQNTVASVGEDAAAVAGQVVATDVDDEADPLTFHLVDDVAKGKLSFHDDGSWSFDPNGDFEGLDDTESAQVTFTYWAFDGTDYSEPATVTITVNGANDAPVAEDTVASGDEDTTITGAVPAAEDVDGETLTYAVHGNAPEGLTFNADGTFSYVPPANFNGAVSFQYVANDGTVASAAATVTITVNPVNDAPAGADKTVTVLEDGAYSFAAADFGFSDAVEGDALAAVVIATLPMAGTLKLDGAAVTAGQAIAAADLGKLSFAPAADANGEGYASFTFQVQDDGGTANGGQDTDQSPNTITIDVTPVNDAPSFGGNSTGTVREDTTLTTGGTLSVSDPDAGESGFQAVAAGDLVKTYGSFTFDATTGAWAYALNNGAGNVQALITGQSVTDTLTVRSTDGTATDIVVTIQGMDEPVTAATLPVAFTGEGDPSDTVGGSLSVNLGATNGADTLVGTGSGDSIAAGNGSDVVYARGGNDTVNGGNLGDTLYGQGGDDTLSGDTQDDVLYGGSGADSIAGGNGADSIVGGFGADTLTGDGGADRFIYLDPKDTNDTITDFMPGEDKIDLSALYAGTLGFNAAQSQSLAAAHSVSWFQAPGNTVVIVELDGDTASAELMITLTGLKSLAATDFVL